ncbi:ADP-dependent NAD(P)H-hydrate dehydratase [Nakamurella sp.]|uniref:ADP-dependent NAD(P)H-hydrate dehydratase n=1 Tax=Nakamurella sp. TaxID=1869182 RepID=UPI003B3B115D
MPSRTEATDRRSTALTRRLLRDWPLPAPSGSGKASRGDVWVVGGAGGTPGAAMLAGRAALRVGAGRLTLAVAESVAPAVAVAVPESGVHPLPQTGRGSVRGDLTPNLVEQLPGCDALLVGSGLDDPDRTAALVTALLPVVGGDTSVVLDAYALGILPGLPEVSDRWGGRLVLTPNLAELERLLDLRSGGLADPADLPDAVRRAARQYRAVITCHNVIADPAGSSWQAAPTCIGLGTSGSGDVLGGMVLGLLGRGAVPARAACWATYLHLAAGHRLTRKFGTVGFLAGDLLVELPGLLDELRSLG